MDPLNAHATASVLVVDDDEMVRELIREGFQEAGVSVTTAASGVEALTILRRWVPDLVISDVTMPDMDGFALVSALRADPATRSLPLILLTARVDPEDAVVGLRLGADDYIRKPFELTELMARVLAKMDRRPIPVDELMNDPRTGVMRAERFAEELDRESERAGRTDRLGAVAVIDLDERGSIRDRFGPRADDEIALRVVPLLRRDAGRLELVGRDDDGRFLLLLPETGATTVAARLADIAQRLAATRFFASGEQVSVTPTIGWTTFAGHDADLSGADLVGRALLARDASAAHLDLQPVAWSPELEVAPAADSSPGILRRLGARLRTPLQILSTVAVGVVVPFVVYVVLYHRGIDISTPVYLFLVVALAVTAAAIWTEGFLALDPERPPEEATGPPPPASAVIAAYLPNEAATIVETLQSFLRCEYPSLQIVLAYNTPRPLPIEATLHELAAQDPRLVILRVEGSTSKAQNVNAALGVVTGEFVGVFDADHQPAPGSFLRAWRWLSNGYDVVQGHCVVRNGDASWVARTVAVEFEAIYAVSHPGRARLHGFGVFGGSNGYWKTDLLRRTRMHGFMLTEDIDSSLRVIEQGGRIANDPGLISRELAPTTVGQLWNQRMRWAQGWFQVSRKHFGPGWRSPHLTLRQKLGLTFLLGWREVYPWISLQMLPLVAFLGWREGGLDHLNWLISVFVLSSLFTLSVGPGQTFFARRLAVPEIRRRRSWFWWYLLTTSLVYSEWKNIIGRVAHIKEAVGERQWKVTPRLAPVEGVPAPSASEARDVEVSR
ncbi:MAG TPA: response regulator [Actinotalea sp.]